MTGGKAWPILLLIFSATASAGNFATCILDMAPDAESDIVARAVVQECDKKHPGGYPRIYMGSGLSWIPFVGYTSPAACVISNAAKTRNHGAQQLIARACHCLYTKPAEDGAICFYPEFKSVR